MSSLPTKSVTSPEHLLKLGDLTKVLVRHFDLHDGLYEASIELNLGIGQVQGQDQAVKYPGVAIGISGIGLTKTAVMGPHTVDAAVVNPPAPPAPAKRKRVGTAAT